jgi:hypothetical protein
MRWINIEEQPMPLETDIIVSHKYGVEAIHFYNAKWTYWYSNNTCSTDLLQSITHWCKPESV